MPVLGVRRVGAYSSSRSMKKIFALFVKYRPECIVIVASTLLSLWLIQFDNVVNRDGVFYLMSAKAFAQGDWRSAFGTFQWPLFAFLIAAVHHVTGFAFDVSAWVLNTALYALVVWAFVRIVAALGGSERVRWFAALFILILPSINSYRTDVIRDPGFWAFYLVALLLLLQYLSRPALMRALGWGAAIVVATLFRIEGAVFLLLLPLAAVWCERGGWRAVGMRLAQLYSVALAGVVGAIGWLSWPGHQGFAGRFYEPVAWLSRFIGEVGGGLTAKADLLAQSVLNKYSDGFALSGLLLLIALIVVTHALKGLGVLGIWMGARAWWVKSVPAPRELKVVLAWAVALNVVTLIVFVTTMFFLTGRYAIALVLVAGLYVPFGLDAAYTRWKANRPTRSAADRAQAAAILILVLYMAIDCLWSFGASKAYLRDAGLWIDANVPVQARLYSSDSVLAYYANRGMNTPRQHRWKASAEDVVDDERLSRWDYLALVLKQDEKLPDSLVGAPVLKEFSDERNDRVLIFKISDLSRR